MYYVVCYIFNKHGAPNIPQSIFLELYICWRTIVGLQMHPCSLRPIIMQTTLNQCCRWKARARFWCVTTLRSQFRRTTSQRTCPRTMKKPARTMVTTILLARSVHSHIWYPLCLSLNLTQGKLDNSYLMFFYSVNIHFVTIETYSCVCNYI